MTLDWVKEFLLDRDACASALDAVQTHLCCYIGPEGRGRCRCDCKFGVTPADETYQGEVTGCPEMRSLAILVGLIPTTEWNRLVRSVLKKHTSKKKVK